MFDSIFESRRRKRKTQTEIIEILQDCKKCHLILSYSRIGTNPPMAFLVLPDKFKERIHLSSFNALQRKGLIKQQKVITDNWMGTTTKWVLQ